MLNLSDVTSFYIENKFINEMKILILDAFSLMEDFGINFYEDKYIDLITRYEAMPDDDIYTLFNNYIVKDIVEIIEAHGVEVDSDGEPSLSDLLEIAHGLLLLANLEDYSYVRYRVYTEQTSRNVLLDLLERYTLLSRVRLMEVIGEVKETIIESLKSLTVDSEEEESTIDMKHHKHVSRFFTYIEGTPCLASTLKEKGFGIDLTLEELVNLQTLDMINHIETTSSTNLAQAALDIFSLMVYTKDDFTLPVFKFKKNSHIFTSDADLTMRLHNALFAMVNDFSIFLEACNEKEKTNAN